MREARRSDMRTRPVGTDLTAAGTFPSASRLAAAAAAALLAAAAGPSAGEGTTPPAHVPGTIPGRILCEFWDNIGGTSVRELTGCPAFPASPSESVELATFEIPVDRGDNYGTRVRGYIHPPATGEYVFWISGDDNSELWLSTDDKPEGKTKIAEVAGWTGPREWIKEPGQQSKPIRLEAGKAYYIEALHKEGGGNDNLAVGWRLPDGKEERPIPGSRLSAIKPPPIPPPKIVNRSEPLPREPGHHKMWAEVLVQGQTVRLPYLVYLPLNFGKDPKEKPPVMLFLHGVGECGTDLQGIYVHGPAPALRDDAKFRERYPFVGISPQLPPGARWEHPPIRKATLAILDKAIEDFGADGDRVYCTGLSMGGTGTWHIALEAPDRFAALAPISGTAVQPDLAKEKLSHVPVLIITGGSDGAYTEGARRMWQALQESEPKALLTVVEGAGHDVWTRYYSNPQFYEWLLKFRRIAPAATAAGKRPTGKSEGGGKAGPGAAPASSATASKTPGPQAPSAVEPPKPLPLTTGPLGQWAGTWIAAGMCVGTAFLILAFLTVLPKRQ